MKMIEDHEIGDINIVPSVSIHYSSLLDPRALRVLETRHYHDQYHMKLQELFNYLWSNTHTYVTDIRGMMYPVMINGSNGLYYISIWSIRGSYLMNWEHDPQSPTAHEDKYEFEREFSRRTDIFAQGFMICTKCNNPMLSAYQHPDQLYSNPVTYEYEAITRKFAGSHFAAIFCNKCFVGDIKRNAESENYE